MFCHRCGVEVQPKQRFCGDCGVSLTGVTDPTEELIRPSPARAADPLISSSFTDQLPVTQAVTRSRAFRRPLASAAARPSRSTTSRPTSPTTSPIRPCALRHRSRRALPAPRSRSPPTRSPPSTPPPAPTGPQTLQMPMIDPHEGRLRRFRFRFGVVSGYCRRRRARRPGRGVRQHRLDHDRRHLADVRDRRLAGQRSRLEPAGRRAGGHRGVAGRCGRRRVRDPLGRRAGGRSRVWPSPAGRRS